MGCHRTEPFTNFRERRLTGPRSLVRTRASAEKAAPGYGWWYAVTVIDYYSRYLLACHLTSSYSAAETAYALKLARRKRSGFTVRW